jgi:hypothetical protein
MARRDPTCIRLATALAVAAVSVAGAYGAFVAGGADSYGYISEADLWLSGSLHIAQPFTADLPWPDARWTFSPLGYRPAPLGESLVPVHAPGLPLLMATAKSVAGQCAVFAVVPLSAGLFVLGTYGVGRRLGRPMAGLAAALLVATSPTTIFLSLNPMSDLPSAAAWTWSLVFILGGTARNAAISGLAAALATLIRPNLMVLLPAFGVYALAEDIRASGLRPTGWARTFWFSLGAGLGLVALGIINNHLYGSPLDSGYGTLDYAVDHFAGNTLRYAGWLVATDTPVAFLGLAALAIPAAALWPTARERRLLWFLATLAATVWVPFLFYAEFEAWWYLRYALPAWPLMMIGVAAVAGALDRLGARVARVAAFGLIVGLALHGIHAAQHLDVFRVAAVEGKYRQAARMITERTPTGSVILSKQHSGSLRYYAGRLTARWDMIEPGWMGRVVEWLAAHGHRPYFLLEEDEVDLLRR